MYQVLLFKSRRHLCKGSMGRSGDGKRNILWGWPYLFDTTNEEFESLDGKTKAITHLASRCKVYACSVNEKCSNVAF